MGEKKYICKLRNSLYTFKKNNVNEVTLFTLGNMIYPPSYISMESALSFYGIIPEGVYTVTSCTTSKTKRFKNAMASFDYRHVKKDLFFGYKICQIDNVFFLNCQ